MKLVLVGVRQGIKVIHWPGVVAASLIVMGVSGLGAFVTYWLLGGGFPLLPTLVPTMGMLLGTLAWHSSRSECPPEFGSAD